MSNDNFFKTITKKFTRILLSEKQSEDKPSKNKLYEKDNSANEIIDDQTEKNKTSIECERLTESVTVHSSGGITHVVFNNNTKLFLYNTIKKKILLQESLIE